MCGIAGFIKRQDAAPLGPHVIRDMIARIGHRGPDGTGYYEDGDASLGHARLSIIDLVTGDQPIVSESGRYAIVFNGEIYNYKELQVELRKRGHNLTTTGDTEVILRLFQDYGVDCLRHLNGMFAFVIWDRVEKRLFAARDRMGEKPIYYAKTRQGFAFASELKSLLRFPGIDRSIRKDAVDDYLAYGYVPSPKSIYAGAAKLPPAHYMLYENGKMRIERYWRVEEDERSGSSGDYLDELEELLRDSIRMRLRSDVPIGAFLSGGVDSSLIVAMASELYDGELSTFTIGFSDQAFDESKYARKVAEKFGINSHEIVLEPIGLKYFDTLISHFDEPFADASALPTYYVTKAASNHLKVCISGDAGDELFGGYSQYLWEPLERTLDTVPAGIRRPFFAAMQKIFPQHIKGQGWLARMAASGAERLQRKVGVFDTDERARLLRPEFHDSIDATCELFMKHYDPNHDPIRARMIVDRETYLADDILVKVDRMSMLNSLEVRVPLLDHRIVEFAQSQPLDRLIHRGVQKHPLKRLLAKYMPQDFIDRPKSGFGIPLADWLRGDHRDLAEDLLLSRDACLHEILRPEALSNLFEAHQKGARDFGQRLWTLMCFEQWWRSEASESAPPPSPTVQAIAS